MTIIWRMKQYKTNVQTHLIFVGVVVSRLFFFPFSDENEIHYSTRTFFFLFIIFIHLINSPKQKLKPSWIFILFHNYCEPQANKQKWITKHLTWFQKYFAFDFRLYRFDWGVIFSYLFTFIKFITTKCDMLQSWPKFYISFHSLFDYVCG